ncbi:MAG: 30S ribosomal protein S20 [Firmicutes bacterium]|nr:30S ribosomal protein S20 [Bacillota bacterium]
MPNIKSAGKRVRVTKVKTARNTAIKSSVKTAIKRYEVSLSGGDTQAAQEMLRKAVSAIDKAAAKGVIHKNQAARRKSRLAKKLLAAAGVAAAE